MLSEEEKEEFEHIKKRAEFVIKNIMGTNVFTTYDVHCVNTLIDIIEKQQKELNSLKEIEQLHKEENGKLRVEFEKIYEDNLTLAQELEQEKEKNKKLEEKYKRLSIEAQATAFEDDNIDTEGLLRVLLKQGEITLNEKGEYQRKDFDWEENMMQLGLMKKREKTFYIPDDECLDEYTKQLESQLKEYDELKRIFRERNITNETMYDGFCRLFDEVNELKEKNKDLTKQLNGAFDRGFISKDKIRAKVIQVKDRPVKDEFITATQGKLNTIIVLEELLEEK